MRRDELSKYLAIIKDDIDGKYAEIIEIAADILNRKCKTCIEWQSGWIDERDNYHPSRCSFFDKAMRSYDCCTLWRDI